MYRVSVMRLTVLDEKAAEFEEKCAEQVERVKANEPGTALYVFCKRGEGSTVMDNPRNGNTEYIHLQAYLEESDDQNHSDLEKEWWGPTFRSYLNGPWASERYYTDDITTGITRDWDWGPDQYRFSFFRFRIKEGQDEEFEGQSSHQIGVVTKGEPGTVLYTMIKRPEEGSTLLPRSPKGVTEYLHMNAYKDEESSQHHRKLEHRDDGKWCWGPTYRTYLDTQWVNESFSDAQILCGISRDAQWGAVWGDVDIAPIA
jgi:quinol monooxygenase YgiN